MWIFIQNDIFNIDLLYVFIGWTFCSTNIGDYVLQKATTIVIE